MDGAAITVVGVGGGGGNALASMLRRGLPRVRTVAANTDRQALEHHPADVKVALGGAMTRGLGAGADPDVGRRAAQETMDELAQATAGADLVFVTAGMGGGTGTGAAPVVAEVAKRAGALTVGVVTRPFVFEGGRRRKQAEAGIAALVGQVDALIVVSNDRLMETSDDATMLDAFDRADAVLFEAVQGITGLVHDVGYVNADFADLRAVLGHTGLALMGAGSGTGPTRALDAAQRAVASPLLEGVSVDGAQAMLVNFRAGPSLGLRELNEAMSWLHDRADPDANIIFGSVVDAQMGDDLRVTLVATGFSRPARRVRESLAPEAPAPRPFVFRAPATAPAAYDHRPRGRHF